MESQSFHIIKYSDTHRDQVLDVWEKSVLATHHLLKPKDFDAIKKIVQSIDFNALDVFCLVHQNIVVGFMGIASKKVEMLFLSPDYLRHGLGKKLMRFAIAELKVDKVDVNEQNQSAVAF